MILTGQLDSPFVRRVAIALGIYGLPFERNVISAYDDFSELLALNPLGKVPALQLDDGVTLADSTLILDYLDHLAERGKSLWPASLQERAGVLAHVGIAVGLAEKAVELRTETVRRAPEKIDTPRVERVLAQIAAALAWLENHTPEDNFIGGAGISHADIASTVAVTFIASKNPEHLEGGASTNLTRHAARCEALEPFKAAPFPNI